MRGLNQKVVKAVVFRPQLSPLMIGNVETENNMNTIKRKWGAPSVDVQEFVPQEYCDACFTYKATLQCVYGYAYNHSGTGYTKWGTEDGLEHGAACANSYLTVTVENGAVTYAGHEGADKPDVALESVFIPNIENLKEGDVIASPTAHWGSNDGKNGYYHKGGGTVTDWEMTWAGHPMHS